MPAEVVFGAPAGSGRLTVQEIASIEDDVIRAAALSMHDIGRIEDYVLRYAAVKERAMSRKANNASSSGHCPGGSVEAKILAIGTSQNSATSNAPDECKRACWFCIPGRHWKNHLVHDGLR